MALKIWVAGEQLLASDLNGNFFWNVAKKTADQSKTSNITLAADTELQFPVLANTSYAFRICVLFNTSTTPGFKFDLDGPASPTNLAYQWDRTGAGSTTVAQAANTALNIVVSVTGSTGAGLVFIKGILQNGANPGTFSFRWAQNASDVNATKVLKGSYLEYMIL